MKKALFVLPVLFTFSIVETFAALSDEEMRTNLGEWDFRTGIWEDQWDYYSPAWLAYLNALSEEELAAMGITPEDLALSTTNSDNWVGFRDANSGGGQGVSPLYQSYREFVNMQVAVYIAENPENAVPVNGGLACLGFAGLIFGVVRLNKRKAASAL